MDIDSNLNGNSKQVGNLTVLIGSDPFLPQLDYLQWNLKLSLWMKI